MKKMLSVLLASAMALSAVGGLAACGGEKEDPNTLTVWAPDNAVETYKALAAEFTSTYEDGKYKDYKIQFVSKGEGEVKDALVTNPSKGADVFFFEAGQIRDMIAQNLLQPLTGDYASYGAAVASRDIESYSDAIKSNNAYYGFPTTTDNGWFMWYDSEFFTEDDITSLDTIVEKSKQSNRQIAFPYNDGWYISSFFFSTGCTMDYVGDEYKADIAGANGEIAGKALVKYFGKDNNVMDNGKICIFAPTTDTLNTAAANGIKNKTVSCGFIGTWVSKDMPANAKAAPCPNFMVDGEDYHMRSFSGGKYCGVNPRRNNKAVAVALADFFTGQKGQEARYDNTGVAPSNKVVAESEKVKNDAVLTALIEQNKDAYAQLAQPQTMWDTMKSFGNNLATGKVTLDNLSDKLAEAKTAIEKVNSQK